MSEFEAKPAVRSNMPLLLGICGSTGSGKTFSSLRLATGIQSVVGGKGIHMIDTENRRGEHYADYFKFQHVDFKPPFSSLRYLEAIKHQVEQGSKVIVVDSGSHEHDGEGGMLDYQEKEFARMQYKDTMKMLSWGKPKAERRAFINGILRMNANIIFCFRAKSVVKPVKNEQSGKTEMVPQGWEPISGKEIVFEFMCNFVLMPKSNGIPTWNSTKAGEAMTMKMPEQFKVMLANPEPLSEDLGRRMAEWAKGSTSNVQSPNVTIDEAKASAEHGTEALKIWWAQLDGPNKTKFKTLKDGELKKIAAEADKAFADSQEGEQQYDADGIPIPSGSLFGQRGGEDPSRM